MEFNVVVEGRSDSGAALRLLEFTGHQPARTIISRGCSKLDAKVGGYRRAAHFQAEIGWLVLRDADNLCPTELRTSYDPAPPISNFVYRVAQRMIEAWLLADREHAAEYFKIPAKDIPITPDQHPHPKRLLLQLCQTHSPKSIREDMVANSHDIGPLYADHLIEFAQQFWDLNAAIGRSPSLERAVKHLASLP